MNRLRFLLLFILSCVAASAQSAVMFTGQAGGIPFQPRGYLPATADPATCIPGVSLDVFRTDLGARKYCSATNTWTQYGAGSSGTVTSVGLLGTANQLTVTGSSPITGAGSFTLSFPSTVTFPGTVTNNLSIFGATTSAQLAGVLSDETGSGLAVFGTSPTIVTPTIASFANANHSHTNSAGGGQLNITTASNATGTPSSSTFLRGDNTWSTPSGSGTVTVVGAGNLTSTALVTGGGSQAIQTPSATATLDTSGNASFPGTLSSGVGSGVAGSLDFAAGTAASIPANSFGWGAPTTMTTSQRLVSPNSVTSAHSLMVLGAPTSNASTWAYKVVPDCTDTGGNHLNFTQSTDAFSCGTSGGGGTNLTVGTSTITSGTTTRILYDNAGVLGEYTLTGSGTIVAMKTSPQLTTPDIGVATGTSLALGTSPPSLTPGTGGADAYNEGTIPTVCKTTTVDCIYADSTQHGLLASFNNGSYLPLVQGPASWTTAHVVSSNGTNGGLVQDSGIATSSLITGSPTNHGVALGSGTQANGYTGVGATNTVLHGNTGADPTYSAIVAADITSATITGTQIASSIALAGSPTTTTQSANDNSTKIATTAYIDTKTREYALNFIFDGGGSAVATGNTVSTEIPRGGTLVRWCISVDAGTATFKTWKAADGTAIPTSGNSINTSGIAISANTNVCSTTLSDFTTTTFTQFDQFIGQLSAVATAKWVSVQLFYTSTN